MHCCKGVLVWIFRCWERDKELSRDQQISHIVRKCDTGALLHLLCVVATDEQHEILTDIFHSMLKDYTPTPLPPLDLSGHTASPHSRHRWHGRWHARSQAR